jgi:DNA polymerase beta
MADHKAAIIAALETMRKKELIDKEKFKAAAYSKVIKQIDELPAVHSIADLAGVKGIGEKIRAKLEEIIATGTLKSAERARAEKGLNIYETLLNVHGIGPAKAKQLVEAGVKNIAGLRSAVDVNPRILSNIQKAGLKYYEDINERIPREEVAMHEEIIQAAFRDVSLESTVVGSYRRGQPTSGDIDILVTGDQSQFIAGLLRLHRRDPPYILETLAEGITKGLYITRLGPTSTARRVDILYTSPEEYPYAVLYFTGSKEFNIAMRKWALDRGYSLNEHGLTNMSTGELVEGLGTEKNIFDFLGMEYVPPSDRTGTAVRAAAPASAQTSVKRPLKIIRIPVSIQEQLLEYTEEMGKEPLGENDTAYYFRKPGTRATIRVRLSVASGAQSELGANSSAAAALMPLTDLDRRRFESIRRGG